MTAFFLLNNIRKKNKARVYRNRTNPIELFDDAMLINRYRLPRKQIVDLIDLCRADMDRSTQRSCPINPDLQVLITLRYLAKGGFQSELADLHGVSKPSVSRSISSTVDLLKTKLDYVQFPKDELNLRRTKENFYKLVRFPNVIGCIDGTLVPIIRPKDDEFVFVCRKGYHAVNIQAICDADLRFTNVVCKWPGSTHDSYSLTNSHIGRYLEEDGGRQGWLLGDSGYPCRPWLLTPLLNPQTESEEGYNKAHIGTRNTIERAFGVLKVSV